MNLEITNPYLPATSLREPRAVHTVLAHMAGEEERAARVQSLKESRPGLTWGAIADYCGVVERSVMGWRKTGVMDYRNAIKLAEMFDVSVDWLWSGSEQKTREPTPGIRALSDQLAHIEKILGRIATALEAGIRLDAPTPELAVLRALQETERPPRAREGTTVAPRGRAEAQ